MQNLQCPVLVRQSFLIDAKIFVLVLGEAKQVGDDSILFGRISAVNWMHILDFGAPVLAFANPFHPLETAQ